MQILSIRPTAGVKEAAYFDVEISPHLRLFNLILRRTPDGRFRTFAPKAFGKHAASFHPELAQQITDAAAAALGGNAAHADRH
ncbi:hypothetical protein BMJ29_21000 [Sinorhizobium medicae]|jgi:hypothetical protein|uniref:KTSC domain-containing protein n=1 Tax=Sinorhizobium medicae TaxID=110321 RepID=A0ABX4TLR0_9HYPH|nr:hypothetical protein BMJ33_12975 [Sinorhizobium medicae]PLU17440.1 hypothetical protein BMJ29_21000 [Sinorhizobium medicae]PLU77038.1 hypothetical protein BMJ19_26440 [Sinorhizobium medicae]